MYSRYDSMRYFDYNKVTRFAIIDGLEVEYDMCDDKPFTQDYYPEHLERFEYIGKGYISNIGGVKQSFTEEDVEYFYRLKK